MYMYDTVLKLLEKPTKSGWLRTDVSRNSAVVYWKSANLIGSPTVFYLPIEISHTRVALNKR